MRSICGELSGLASRYRGRLSGSRDDQHCLAEDSSCGDSVGAQLHRDVHC